MYTTNPESQLALPHYSEPIWKSPQLIYLKLGVDKSYRFQQSSYSDRLMQWDIEAHERGNNASKFSGVNKSANNVALYLKAYHQQEVDLMGILGGVDLSSSFPYYIYCYDLLD